ncbi:MAG: SDR family oxidoreductase [Solirubrobacterales bacterium]|nr:SDR family oxidoreductase [Solirubrobacterales bacterium]
MPILLQGNDDSLEAALREQGLEPIRRGHAHALVTMGPCPTLRPLAEIDADEWRARFERWVADTFWAFQAWLRETLARGVVGRWVAITTTLGAQPFPGGGADGAFAVALQTLVRIAAIEYGPRGVRANAIAPGWREERVPADLDRELATLDTPTGRLVTDGDIAATVAWLLSPHADQLNGEVLHLDGGYTITRGTRPDPRRQ